MKKVEQLALAAWLAATIAVNAQVTVDSLTNGLIAYYPFNGNANDASGRANHGSNYGALLTSDCFGSTNSAYYFNGTDSYIRASADSLPTTNRTVAFWFYANTVDAGLGVLGYGGYGGASFLMLMNQNDGGQNQYETQGHNRINRLLAPMGTNVVGVWHHWAVTILGSRTTMFIDGKEIGAGDVFSTPTGVIGKDLIIGTDVAPNGIGPYSDGNAGLFHGALDEVRIYNRALSSEEIATLAGQEQGCPHASIRVSEVEICWESQSNKLYEVDYRSDLTTSLWAPLATNVLGNGMTMCISDRVAPGQPQRFYRLACP